MDVIDKLKYIEKEKVIYNIHYCRAGVGFCFYESEKSCREDENWRDNLNTNGYHKDFDAAVNAEYEKLINE